MSWFRVSGAVVGETAETFCRKSRGSIFLGSKKKIEPQILLNKGSVVRSTTSALKMMLGINIRVSGLKGAVPAHLVLSRGHQSHGRDSFPGKS